MRLLVSKRIIALKIVKLLILLLVLMLAPGCISIKKDEFAIYLAKEKASYEVTDAQMTGLTLEDKPFITTDDIVAYDKNTHRVELTPAATEKLRKFEVPVSGRLFVACVGEKHIYAGAFMTPVSSFSFSGVVIMTWLDSAQNTILIGLGYPGPDFFKGSDPRNSPEVFAALQRAGKLK